jgi:hypothetical protein
MRSKLHVAIKRATFKENDWMTYWCRDCDTGDSTSHGCKEVLNKGCFAVVFEMENMLLDDSRTTEESKRSRGVSSSSP